MTGTGATESGVTRSGVTRDERVRALHRARPRRTAVTVTVGALAAGTLLPWLDPQLSAPLWTERTARNVDRFLTEIRPYPLQDAPWDWAVYGRWLVETFAESAPAALGTTLALSVAAIVLAGAAGLAFGLLGARNLAAPRPFETRRDAPAAAAAARALRGGTQALTLFLRAVPEYVWAFLLLSLMGVGPWPAVLALAAHNAGILGRLYAETVENMDPRAPRTLAALGADPVGIAAVAVVPRNLGRFLLYFFYRWETCVREATVLGLLGFVSIGAFIQEARAAVRYDEMVHYVALGAVLILIGDAVSAGVRRAARNG